MSNNTPKPSPARDPSVDKSKPIHKADKGQKKGHGKRKGFTSSNYRTEKCEFYNKGHCSKGDECTYSHDFVPDSARKMCKFFLSGSCSKENDCPYSHDTRSYPCRFHHLEGKCGVGMECKFSHQPLTETSLQHFASDNKDLVLKLHRDNKLSRQAKETINFIKEETEKKQERVLPPIASTVTPQPSKPLIKDDPRKRVMKPLSRPKEAITQQSKKVEVQDEKEEGEHSQFMEQVLRFIFAYY